MHFYVFQNALDLTAESWTGNLIAETFIAFVMIYSFLKHIKQLLFLCLPFSIILYECTVTLEPAYYLNRYNADSDTVMLSIMMPPYCKATLRWVQKVGVKRGGLSVTQFLLYRDSMKC